MKSRERGYLLLALLLALLSLSAVYLVAGLSKQSSRAERRAQKETLRALADARIALIAHGLIEDSTPGTLPKPSDVEGDWSLNGWEGGSYAPKLPPLARRFPWYTLGLNNQSDGNGDCLWYALSGIYSNVWSADDRPVAGATINPNRSGTLQLNGAPVIAVVLSPGRALSSQTERGDRAPGKCAGGAVDQFLEGTNGSTSSRYITSPDSPNANDIAIGITHTQMLKPVLKRILQSLAGSATRELVQSRMAAQGATGTLAALRGTAQSDYEAFDATILEKYRTEHPDIPSAALVAKYEGSTCPKVNVPGEAYKTPPSWLCFNDWYSHIWFHADEHGGSLSVALAPPSTYRCTMALDTAHITCTN